MFLRYEAAWLVSEAAAAGASGAGAGAGAQDDDSDGADGPSTLPLLPLPRSKSHDLLLHEEARRLASLRSSCSSGVGELYRLRYIRRRSYFLTDVVVIGTRTCDPELEVKVRSDTRRIGAPSTRAGKLRWGARGARAATTSASRGEEARVGADGDELAHSASRWLATEPAGAAASGKRRSAGDLLFGNSRATAADHLDRVRSCGSIAAASRASGGGRAAALRARRQHHHSGGSGASADGDDDDDDDTTTVDDDDGGSAAARAASWPPVAPHAPRAACRRRAAQAPTRCRACHVHGRRHRRRRPSAAAGPGAAGILKAHSMHTLPRRQVARYPGRFSRAAAPARGFRPAPTLATRAATPDAAARQPSAQHADAHVSTPKHVLEELRKQVYQSGQLKLGLL
ncbi:Protein of unknown function [Gryllus bimaculatus]|nr:Protein of unknown function [Gryllus bimaculatus]